MGNFGLGINGMVIGGRFMKLFVVSDVHGHLKEMNRDLKEKGYDSTDDNNLLIVLGDLFDRGEQSKEIFEELKSLVEAGKAVVLHGNHEDFIIEFLEGKDCYFNYAHNGFGRTIDSFLGQTRALEMFLFYCQDLPDAALSMYGDRVKPILGDTVSVPFEVVFDIFQEYAREEILKDNPDLLKWLRELPFYYETENYIFTHASIDGSCKDWKNPKKSKYSFWTPWQYLTWDEGDFYEKPITNTDKTVVVGHFHTDAIRERYGLEPGKLVNDILYGDRKIFIDACTILTKRVNVLVIEDNREE